MIDDGRKIKQISRATLEATFQAQEKLRKKLAELIEENRPLKDEQERDFMFRSLTYSTFGLGKDIIIKGKCDGTSSVLIRTDLETFSRWLFIRKENPVETPLFFRPINGEYLSNTHNIEINILWSILRDYLFTVFPLAIERATNLSKEHEEKNKSMGYKIRD